MIAENYDAETPAGVQSNTRQKTEKNASGARGCPNKWNPYHYCVQFCYDHWKDGTNENRFVAFVSSTRLSFHFAGIFIMAKIKHFNDFFQITRKPYSLQ